jgi:hypothetical protein
VKSFNGNGTIEALIPCFVDDTHTAFTDFALDAVIAYGLKHSVIVVIRLDLRNEYEFAVRASRGSGESL